ncbi:MAG: hypothetical protein J6A90_02330 [Clostridia bacterium]|nr:hypothetical protein [Clostridia bacterium]
MNENKFEYTYRALSEEQKRVISSIKGQYDVKAETPAGAYEEIVRLDKKVKSTAMALAISVGTIGLLIFGLGLTMVLEWQIYLWGILVGLIGAIPCALAMPIYLLSMKKGKKKYGARILELSSELLGENNEGAN